ncbi:hypothetical protein [Ancylobacter mangrovi]|uniref:hypothetical protein n=1 Tax=Ancylobacter mangrovi TaxID=2972472 RepID=UPI002162EC75|nr:hypothetical protein [Ancylobacter mangrovi]MCS0501052.1 hypothetical protein [Ancylobacter mangrovi]
MLLFALGFIHRALVDIAHKLDGAVHFEPEEEEMHHGAAAGAVLAGESEALPIEPDHFMPEIVLPAEPEPAAAPPPPGPAPEAKPAEEKGGLPTWFRRKREPEVHEAPEPAPAPEPAALPEPRVQEPRVPEPRAQEPRPFESRPFEPRPSESRAAEPRLGSLRPEPARREPPPFLREGRERLLGTGGADTSAPAPTPAGEEFTPRFGEPRTPASPPVVPPPAPSAPHPSAPMSEPRPPRVRDETIPDPGAPPAFLRESDLLGGPEEMPEEAPPEPSVTVLKAGTIGGMAYKLYSDGSIEADLPDGTLRFASLQDLRDHVSGGGAPRPGGEG